MDFGNGNHRLIPVLRALFIGTLSLQFWACCFPKPEAPVLPLQNLCRNHDLIPSMGTTFELFTLVDCQSQADKTIAIKVKKVLDRYETSLSLYQPESEISRLNRFGFLKSPTPQFLEALSLGLTHAEQTEGYFDPTIRRGYRLIENQVRKSGIPPSDSELQKLIPLTDFRQVRISEHEVRLQKKGMEITLDGNVKGLAVDRIADLLMAMGIGHFVANFSGNMRVAGRQLNGKPWKVTVDHPLTRKEIPIPFPFEAISTSAPTYNHFTADRSWHHLLNPRTLKPALLYSSVTVFGPLAETCDALSTAVFMMDSALAQAIFKKHFPDYRYWLFLPDGSKLEGP